MALIERIKGIFSRGAPASTATPSGKPWAPMSVAQRRQAFEAAFTVSPMRPDFKAALMASEERGGFLRPPEQALLYAQSVHDICLAAHSASPRTAATHVVAYLQAGTPLEAARAELLAQRAAQDEEMGELITAHPQPDGKISARADGVYERRRQGK